MKLVIITPSTNVPDETSLVTKMFEAGLTILHLRKPRFSTNQMKEYISDIPDHFHNRIVIHSHHTVALKFKLKGVHFSSTHLNKKKLKYWFIRQRIKLSFGKISKSRSYSRLQQVYNKEQYKFDYFLIGTMFHNLTGKYYSGFYEDGVVAAIKNADKKFIARGGTGLNEIKKCADLGFYGIGMNSYIWNSDLPYENFKKVLQTYKDHQIPFD
jgi:thiamine-phosphate pyrophosphorylase